MKQGFLQALGVAVYCSLIGIFILNAGSLFPTFGYLGPIIFLLLFSTSALLCGIMVFYKPYKLFFAGKKEEAVNTVIYTAIFLFLILFIFFGTLFFIR